MSQENVEIVRAIYESWDRGEQLFDSNAIQDDVEFVNPPEAIDPGTRRGIEGFAVAGQAVLDAFGSLSHEVEALRDAEPHVIASVTFKARGSGSGIAVEQSEFHVWTFRGPSVVRLECVMGRDEALDAVGMS